MRDDLIGFVLGALDAEEHDEIRRKVEHDYELKKQVELVERCLRPLAGLRETSEAPCGLADRTCRAVFFMPGNLRAGDDAEDHGAVPAVSSEALPSPQTHLSTAAGAITPASRSPWGADRSDGAMDARRWTTADFVVAAGVCLAMSCLVFPAISNSRYNMQLANCQNNMRRLGQSMDDYSRVAGGYFPVIPPTGNLSFSGVYAPKLAAKGLVHDERVFLCPAKGSAVVLKIPPLQDIAAAKGPRLVSLHRTMGGDYAYALGYLRKGQLHGIRNQGRWNVAILADAPLENLRNSVITTHSRGQNVLFADGHVRLVGTRSRPGSDGDDLFHNDRGFVRAGLHAEDFVLAPSYVSPLPAVDDALDGSTTVQ